MTFDDIWEARVCMRVDERWWARVCMGVEKTCTEFIWELMRIEKRDFNYMTVDDIWEARVCMRIEKRVFI
jgi:hypothetical protein